ncbi:hypothetical protein F4780DRAFT_774526 [Xylariomycetidae sp. FL0641]|nr:hypothetical protein F4780DRAFT_774526 [Xylariomycetidae sp. FL0641]
MENLTIHDPPQPGGPMPLQAGRPFPPQPPQPQQLPPQMFTTAAQLLDLTDKKLLVCLRDGRKLTGVLRSWDQFANLVLQSTTERIFATTSAPNAPQPTGFYADKTHGIFLVRGENVLLLGEIDMSKDNNPPAGFEKAEFEVVEKLAKEKRTADKAREKKKLQKLATHGFEGENMGDILL